MVNRKGFTLIELMVVVLIVAILAAVIVPILRGRLDAARWSEGRAGAGTVATSIRGWAAEHSTDVPASTPTSLGELGFIAGDLTGKYFTDANYSFDITSIEPLVFTVTVTAGTGISSPISVELNELGEWTDTLP